MEGVELEEMLEAIVAEGDAVLARTPEMLPVLKEAGVVDSGGQGLMQVMKGALDVFKGKEVEYTVEEEEHRVPYPRHSRRKRDQIRLLHGVYHPAGKTHE